MVQQRNRSSTLDEEMNLDIPNGKKFEFKNNQFTPIEDDWDEKRMDIIGQNGNNGEHYNVKWTYNTYNDAYEDTSLMGILYENKQGDFFRVHSDFPALLGELSTKNKINKLIHVSALGVSDFSNSVYSRSKAIGERKLIEKFPNAKILRPSLLFGKGDNFFGQFSQMACLSPLLPLISGTCLLYTSDAADE